MVGHAVVERTIDRYRVADRSLAAPGAGADLASTFKVPFYLLAVVDHADASWRNACREDARDAGFPDLTEDARLTGVEVGVDRRPLIEGRHPGAAPRRQPRKARSA